MNCRGCEYIQRFGDWFVKTLVPLREKPEQPSRDEIEREAIAMREFERSQSWQ